MLALALCGVLREDGIALRKPLGQLRLQRIVPVRAAVAVRVDALRPAIPREVGLAEIGGNVREPVEPRLVRIHGRAIAHEYASAAVTNVSDFHGDVGRQLALHRDVVRIDGRRVLRGRKDASADRVRQREKSVRWNGRDHRLQQHSLDSGSGRSFCKLELGNLCGKSKRECGTLGHFV